MPQLAQLGLVYQSQWFWLLLVLAAIYFFAGRGIVPKVEETVDQRDAKIEADLAAAERLRNEAEALRDEYVRKAAAVDKDAEALRARAEQEAADIVEKAKADAAAMIERHKALAAEKIATAERDAIAELRAMAATAAAAAARELIAEKHGEAEDRKLADEIISGI